MSRCYGMETATISMLMVLSALHLVGVITQLKLLGVDFVTIAKVIVLLMSTIIIWAGFNTFGSSFEQPEVEPEATVPPNGPQINLIQQGTTGLTVEVYDITDSNLQLYCDDGEGSQKFAVAKNAVISPHDFIEKIVEKYGYIDYPAVTESKVSVEFDLSSFTSNHEYDCALYSGQGESFVLHDQESIIFEAGDEPVHSYTNLSLTNDWDGLWLTWEDEGDILWDTVLLKDLNHSNYLSYSIGEWEDRENEAYIGGMIPSLPNTYLIGLEGPDINGMENEVIWYKFDFEERCTDEEQCPSQIQLNQVE
ncbi:MAG: hypothetical protein ACKVIR_02060 [Candidatus Poseidoniales archaeon]